MVRQQFLTGTPFLKLLKILIWHRINKKYFLDVLRLIKVSLMSSVFSLIDNLIYDKHIAKTQIINSPVFIIGHWRSGTTYLQKILSQDKQFTTPTFYQCTLPQAFLSSEKFIKPAMEKTLPSTRIFDAMKFGVDEPFDDEFALLKLTSKSHMLHFVFPEKSSFNEYNLNIGSGEYWSKAFIYFAKKITYATKRRLLFKSPMNTLRIKEILELFPDAKFIYLYRNPEDVFSSSLYQTHKLFEHNKLYKNNTEVKKYIFSRYKYLLNAYEKDKKIIPESQLIEIAFESLEKSPVDVCKSIYDYLRIERYNEALPSILSYINSTLDYKKNTYTITKEDYYSVRNECSRAYSIFDFESKDP